MKTGRFDESIAQYRKALSVDPHFTPSQVGIATNLMFQGKHADGAKRDGRSSTGPPATTATGATRCSPRA